MSVEGIEAGPISPVETLVQAQCRTDIPEFRVGDSVRVYSRIIEGSKERLQAFVGVVIKRHKGTNYNATFTVRKVSYGVGVERTFFLHSPLISKIEVVTRGDVRRARLFYLRPLRGKAARIKTRAYVAQDNTPSDTSSADNTPSDNLDETAPLENMTEETQD